MFNSTSAADCRKLEPRAPDVVIEGVSPTSRRFDRVKQLSWYASIGVPEYWLVDPELQTLERLALESERYQIHN